MSAIPSQTCDWTDDILNLEFPSNSVQNTPSRENTLQQEFDAYLLDLQVLSSTLLFWQVCMLLYSLFLHLIYMFTQENCMCYPTMFLMAMDILLIQGLSVPCE